MRKIITMVLFNRPDYTKQVLAALKQCSGIKDYLILLHIEPGNKRVVELARSIDFAQFHITLNRKRLGIGRNTYLAWQHGFSKADFLIHLEDDTVPAPDCLRYMEYCREAYCDNHSIFSISAYNQSYCHPSQYYHLSRRSTYTCWIVGIWRNRWNWIKHNWNPDPNRYGEYMAKHLAKFDLYEVYPLLSRTQNVGAQHGVHVSSPSWHQKHQHTKYWAGDYHLPVGKYQESHSKRTIFKNFQSPGDIVMLTAAVRDLHKCYPGKYLTDVRTSCPALWENNPYITQLDDNDPKAITLQCNYPLVHRSNNVPMHFIFGFIEYLNEKLKLQIHPTEFKGDIYVSDEEKRQPSQVHDIVGEDVPFWIIVAGGKNDFTIKWWDHERFQKVVDHFAGKILFVQVGENGHQHRPLRGVIDLRGKTDGRQFVCLMYHAQGVLTPVTFAMHLATAVEVRPGRISNRPCVVVAGGREPSQWEAYPHHQYIHMNGTLSCCANGGCWKSRTIPLGDGDSKDNPENLCVDVVDHLPRCMDMITAEEVIRRIKLYFDGGVCNYLTSAYARITKPFLLRNNIRSHDALIK
jgi:ADP-heptose:LPS heptosyltransferase